MKKRILSILLAAVMIVSLMPTVAFAADKGLGTGLGEGNAWDISASGDQSVLAWLEETSGTSTYILHIDGTGAMKSFSRGGENLWNNYREKIVSVIISDDITSIGDFAFYECSSLQNVKIPEKVTSIGKNSFDGCSTLTNVTIPSNVTTIGQEAFSGCSTLTGVTFTPPSSIKTINSGAFEDCVALTSLTIPESVTKIYDAVFSGCNTLTEIAVEANNKNYLSEDGILFSKDKTKLICYPANKPEVSYIIPDTVTSINNYAFKHSNLKSVTLPKNLTYMGSYVFYECTNLASISIPSGVTSVGNYAFKSCSSLADVTCLATTPPTLGNNKVFTDCATGLKITVPSQSINAYRTATYWSEYANQIFDKHIVDGVIFEPWTNNNSLPTTVGNYYLGADVEISSTWNVPTGATPTNLDLNGHVIKADTSNSSFSAITIGEGATLNLYDCGTTEHYFTVDDNGLWTLTDNPTQTTKTVLGGVITGGNASSNIDTLKNGGGINVSGTFTMNGGNIVGNTASEYGGGVYVKDGSFTMYDGIVAGNAAHQGGGVYADSTGVTLGGTVKIIENFRANNSADNFYVVGRDPIKSFSLGVGVNEPKAGMHIGIKMQKSSGGEFTANATDKTQVGYFTSDDNTFGVRLSNTNGIELAKLYAITTDGITNGTITTNAKENKAFADDTVTITVTPSSDYRLKANTLKATYDENGEVEGGEKSCELVGTGNTYTFKMPAYAVTVTAEFEKVQSVVTLDKQGGTGGGDSVTATYGEAMPSAAMPTKAGYTFNGYFDAASGGTKYYNANGTSAKNWDKTDAAVTLYAQWTEVHHSSSGGSSSTITVPVSGDASTVKVSASVSGSTATVKPIKDADLAKVADGESVAIDLSGAGKNVDTAKIPTETVEKISEKSALTVKLPVATVEFDNAATAEIADQAEGNNIELVVDSVKEVSLNAVQKESVKKLDTALIIDAHLVSNGERLCSERDGGFGGGKATVTLPYEIKNNRTPANYSVYYVNDAGKLQKLNAKYDEELAAFVFEIEHFSVYAVAYDEYVMPFVDVPETAYYYDAVKWAAANAITSGTDATHFNPNAPVTRAQVVTFLWRAAGCPEPTGSAGKFADVEVGSYYEKAVAWAIEQGVTKGTSDTAFSPDMVCTRGQIVTFLARFAGVADDATGYTHGFTDVKATDYFNNAVAWAKDNKVTEGTSATTFSPNDDCTRAQVVTFLYRWMVK